MVTNGPTVRITLTRALDTYRTRLILFLQPDRPRFSVSIKGPPTFSLSQGHYPLTATLHYHAAVPSQIITVNIFGTPIDRHARFVGRYVFYFADGQKEGEPAEVYPWDYEMADFPLPVCVENQFATFSSHPGQDQIQRELQLPAENYDLIIGCNYRLCLPGGSVDWWDNGPMEAFKEAEVRPTQTRRDSGSGDVIEIPQSNSIEVTVVD
ncbi:MAG: hypothetical protein Q9226_005937 [Calogaya cf. arnoldii]